MVAPEIDRGQVDHVVAGRDALAAGDWQQARASFDAALQETEGAAALEGLSWAAWWLSDPDVLFDARERAYRLYREQDDRRGAARMATWLASDYIAFRGEPAVASGWRQRARRLLDGLEASPEHGWLTLVEGAFAVEVQDDPVTGRRLGAEAVELGRRLGVFDLEIVGLAMEGLSMVMAGEVDDGMRRLDETTAAALAGELEQIFTVPWACCYLIYACERVRDYGRAAQWCEKMKQYALRFQVRCTLGVCHAHYADVMLWRGLWREAETEFAAAIEDLLASRPPWAADAVVRLADLRRRQGRLEEAAALFEQAQGHPLSLLGRAELALDQGQPQEADDLVERYLRHVPPENKMLQSAALELSVRAKAALGDHGRAAGALRTLQAISAAIGTLPVRAATLAAEGALAAAGGEYETARRSLEDATDLFERGGAPYETARARLVLASVLSALHRPDAALGAAREAQAAAVRIGAAREAERATALLQTLQPGDRDRPSGAGAAGPLSPREVEVLRAVAQGRNDREIATQLVLSEHTVHRHISNILAKLGLPSRAAAVAHAAKHGLI